MMCGKKTNFWAKKGCPLLAYFKINYKCSQLRAPQKLKKIEPWAHTESELSMLGVAGKLGKNPIHVCKKQI